MKKIKAPKAPLFFILIKMEIKNQFRNSIVFLRLVASTLVLAFGLTSIVPPSSFAAPEAVARPATSLGNFNEFNLPPELGSVVSEFRGSQPGRFVAYIQDAHASADAQRSIQKIIDHFQSHAELNLVAFEGVEGELDPFLFRAFPKREILENVLNGYVRQGELSGIDFAAAVNTHESRYVGIENRSIYESGIALFLEAEHNLPAAEHALNRIEDEIAEAERHSYPSNLKEIAEKIRDFEQERIDISTLVAYLDQSNIPAPAGSDIEKLIMAMKNMSGGDKEEKHFMERFDPARLWQDVRSWAHTIKEGMYQTDLDRNLDATEERIRFLKDLVRLQLTPEEFQLYLANKSDYEAEQIQSFLKNIGQDSQITFDITSAVLFYRNALVRDHILSDRLITLVSEKNHGRAVFVSGGFHTPGITERLRKENVSFVVIQPAMNDFNHESRYLDVMQGNISYRDRFERNRRGEANLYRAFAEDATERLARKLSEIGPLAAELKNWRDEVIRRRVARGRATDAYRYTYFIDQLADRLQNKNVNINSESELTRSVEGALKGFSQRYQEIYKQKVLAEFHKAMGKAKELYENQALNVENLNRLFFGSTVSGIPASGVHPFFNGVINLRGLPSDDWLKEVPVWKNPASEPENEIIPVGFGVSTEKRETGKVEPKPEIAAPSVKNQPSILPSAEISGKENEKMDIFAHRKSFIDERITGNGYRFALYIIGWFIAGASVLSYLLTLPFVPPPTPELSGVDYLILHYVAAFLSGIISVVTGIFLLFTFFIRYQLKPIKVSSYFDHPEREANLEKLSALTGYSKSETVSAYDAMVAAIRDRALQKMLPDNFKVSIYIIESGDELLADISPIMALFEIELSHDQITVKKKDKKPYSFPIRFKNGDYSHAEVIRHSDAGDVSTDLVKFIHEETGVFLESNTAELLNHLEVGGVGVYVRSRGKVGIYSGRQRAYVMVNDFGELLYPALGIQKGWDEPRQSPHLLQHYGDLSFVFHSHPGGDRDLSASDLFVMGDMVRKFGKPIPEILWTFRPDGKLQGDFYVPRIEKDEKGRQSVHSADRVESFLVSLPESDTAESGFGIVKDWKAELGTTNYVDLGEREYFQARFEMFTDTKTGELMWKTPDGGVMPIDLSLEKPRLRLHKQSELSPDELIKTDVQSSAAFLDAIFSDIFAGEINVRGRSKMYQTIEHAQEFIHALLERTSFDSSSGDAAEIVTQMLGGVKVPTETGGVAIRKHPTLIAVDEAVANAIQALIHRALETPGFKGGLMVRAYKTSQEKLTVEVIDDGMGILFPLREKLGREQFSWRPEGSPLSEGVGRGLIQHYGDALKSNVETIEIHTKSHEIATGEGAGQLTVPDLEESFLLIRKSQNEQPGQIWRPKSERRERGTMVRFLIYPVEPTVKLQEPVEASAGFGASPIFFEHHGLARTFPGRLETVQRYVISKLLSAKTKRIVDFGAGFYAQNMLPVTTLELKERLVSSGRADVDVVAMDQINPKYVVYDQDDNDVFVFDDRGDLVAYKFSGEDDVSTIESGGKVSWWFRSRVRRAQRILLRHRAGQDTGKRFRIFPDPLAALKRKGVTYLQSRGFQVPFRLEENDIVLMTNIFENVSRERARRELDEMAQSMQEGFLVYGHSNEGFVQASTRFLFKVDKVINGKRVPQTLILEDPYILPFAIGRPELTDLDDRSIWWGMNATTPGLKDLRDRGFDIRDLRDEGLGYEIRYQQEGWRVLRTGLFEPESTGAGFGAELPEFPDERQLGEVYTNPKEPLLKWDDEVWRTRGFTTPGAFRLDGKVYLIVRGIDEHGVSRLGLAVSEDGHTVEKRNIFPKPIFEPLAEENELGVENARITIIDEKIYMLYTAREGPDLFRIGLASMTTDEFRSGLSEGGWAKRWNRHKIELNGRWDTNDRNAAIFPEKINGKFVMYFRDLDSKTETRVIRMATADQPEGPWTAVDNDQFVLTPKMLEDRLQEKPAKSIIYVGVGAPPQLTKDGWLTFFHYVDEDHIYRMGFFVSDRENPLKVLYLHDRPIWQLSSADYDVVEPNEIHAITRVRALILLLLRRGSAAGFLSLADAATFRQMRGHKVPAGDRYTIHVSGAVPEFDTKIINPGDRMLLYGGVFNTRTGLGVFEYPEIGDIIVGAPKLERTTLSDKRILVIEDTKEIRDAIVEALQKFGKVDPKFGGEIVAPASYPELKKILEDAHIGRRSFDAAIIDHNIRDFKFPGVEMGYQALAYLSALKGYGPRATIYYTSAQALNDASRKNLLGVRWVRKAKSDAKLDWIVNPEKLVRQDLPAMLAAKEHILRGNIVAPRERLVEEARRLLGVGIGDIRRTIQGIGDPIPLQAIWQLKYERELEQTEFIDKPFGGGIVLVYSLKPVTQGATFQEGDRIVFVHENGGVRTGEFRNGKFEFADRDAFQRLYFGKHVTELVRASEPVTPPAGFGAENFDMNFAGAKREVGNFEWRFDADITTEEMSALNGIMRERLADYSFDENFSRQPFVRTAVVKYGERIVGGLILRIKPSNPPTGHRQTKERVGIVDGYAAAGRNLRGVVPVRVGNVIFDRALQLIRDDPNHFSKIILSDVTPDGLALWSARGARVVGTEADARGRSFSKMLLTIDRTGEDAREDTGLGAAEEERIARLKSHPEKQVRLDALVDLVEMPISVHRNAALLYALSDPDGKIRELASFHLGDQGADLLGKIIVHIEDPEVPQNRDPRLPKGEKFDGVIARKNARIAGVMALEWTLDRELENARIAGHGKRPGKLARAVRAVVTKQALGWLDQDRIELIGLETRNALGSSAHMPLFYVLRLLVRWYQEENRENLDAAFQGDIDLPLSWVFRSVKKIYPNRSGRVGKNVIYERISGQANHLSSGAAAVSPPVTTYHGVRRSPDYAPSRAPTRLPGKNHPESSGFGAEERIRDLYSPLNYEYFRGIHDEYFGNIETPRVVVPAGGSDISSVLLLTNATHALFIDQAPFDDNNVSAPSDFQIERYFADKKKSTWYLTRYLDDGKTSAALKPYIELELRRLGVDRWEIDRLTEEGDIPVFRLRFSWDYPGEDKKAREFIWVSETPVQETGKWLRWLEKPSDGMVIKGQQYLLHDPNPSETVMSIIPPIRPGGVIVSEVSLVKESSRGNLNELTHPKLEMLERKGANLGYGPALLRSYFPGMKKGAFVYSVSSGFGIENIPPARNATALLNLNETKLREILEQIQTLGFEETERVLENELLEAIGNRTISPSRISSLASEMAEHGSTWTTEYLADLLVKEFYLTGYAEDPRLLSAFTLHVNQLVFILKRLEKLRLAHSSDNYKLGEIEKAGIISRIDVMTREDAAGFEAAVSSVDKAIDSVLAGFGFVANSTAVAYERETVPSTMDELSRLVANGKIHYFHPPGQFGVIDQIQSSLSRAKGEKIAELSSLLGAIKRHVYYDEGITPAELRQSLPNANGVLIIPTTAKLAGGSTQPFHTQNIIVYAGREFDESRPGLRILAAKVDQLARVLGQTDAASREGLLRQLEDYGFFIKGGKGSEFIFVDRAAFLAKLEQTFIAQKQTAVAA